MDKVVKYEKLVLGIINEMISKNDSEAVIVDKENRHYFLQWIGFNQDNRFIDKPLLHFQIKPNGKIWILANLTEEDIAEELLKRGVDRTDIVIGFHPEHLRKHTGFAVS